MACQGFLEYNYGIMWKRLAILAVFFAVAQTLVPVPGQASNNPTYRPAQANQGTQHTQEPPAPLFTVPNPAKANPPKGTADAVHGEDAGQPVTITKLVPVSVKRDWLDYATWVGGLAILVIGILGIWLANRTLKAIERQADLTKEQSDLLVEKERAKLRVELDISGLIKDEYGTFNIRGWLSIYGNSEAFIRHSEIYASIGPGGIFNPLPEWTWRIHGVPEVIRSNAEPIEFQVGVMSQDGPAEEAEMVPVYTKETEIHCMAKIEFSDAYGRAWVLRVRRRFVFAWHQGTDGYLGGTWEESGPKDDNGEYRIEEQPQKAN